jgi:hypothetical protein
VGGGFWVAFVPAFQIMFSGTPGEKGLTLKAYLLKATLAVRVGCDLKDQ